MPRHAGNTSINPRPILALLCCCFCPAFTLRTVFSLSGRGLCIWVGSFRPSGQASAVWTLAKQLVCLATFVQLVYNILAFVLLEVLLLQTLLHVRRKAALSQSVTSSVACIGRQQRLCIIQAACVQSNYGALARVECPGRAHTTIRTAGWQGMRHGHAACTDRKLAYA